MGSIISHERRQRGTKRNTERKGGTRLKHRPKGGIRQLGRQAERKVRSPGWWASNDKNIQVDRAASALVFQNNSEELEMRGQMKPGRRA